MSEDTPEQLARDARIRAETIEEVARTLKVFAAARTARVAEYPPETPFAHRSNANVLGAYRNAAEVVREYGQLRPAGPAGVAAERPADPGGTPTHHPVCLVARYPVRTAEDARDTFPWCTCHDSRQILNNDTTPDTPGDTDAH